MRISTSPSPMTTKMVQKICVMPQNLRSNSLSNTSQFSSKIVHQSQTSYVSPYYNVNSSIRYFPKQDLNLPLRITTKQNGISQNVFHMQANMKKLMEKIQMIEKRLKVLDKTQNKQKQSDKQNLIFYRLQQRIQKEFLQKITENNQKIFIQIKKIDQQINHKLQLCIKKQHPQLDSNSNFQHQFIKNNQLQNNQKKNAKLIEEKIKEQIFKIQIHLENQVNKNFSLFKNYIQNNNSISVFSKSKLKYKYRPLQILIKSQVLFNSNENQQSQKIKSDYRQNLSTAYSSTGSSSSQEDRLRKNVIQREQIKYFMDKEGYLLDQNGFYLLNQEQKMIKIDKGLIKKLKEKKIIQ